MFTHKHAKAAFTSVTLGRVGFPGQTLVVDTDLALSSEQPHFGAEALGSLVRAAKGFIETREEYEGIRIEPYRKGAILEVTQKSL